MRDHFTQIQKQNNRFVQLRFYCKKTNFDYTQNILRTKIEFMFRFIRK